MSKISEKVKIYIQKKRHRNNSYEPKGGHIVQYRNLEIPSPIKNSDIFYVLGMYE